MNLAENEKREKYRQRADRMKEGSLIRVPLTLNLLVAAVNTFNTKTHSFKEIIIIIIIMILFLKRFSMLNMLNCAVQCQ